MDLISKIILIFAAVRLIIALYNRLSRPFLPAPLPDINISDLSILIPARNEEKNLPELLSDLQKLNAFPREVLIYDDLSTDRTAAIVEETGRQCSVIQLIRGTALPEGWVGKNYACYSLAKKAKGNYLLFLDADVRISADFPEKILSYLKKSDLKLLSLFPGQQMRYFSTWLSVPLMNWILLSLLPLSLIKQTSFVSFSAANGQCMLFEKNVYDKIEPHKTVRKNPVEDMAIMKLYKRNKLAVAVLLGCRDITCHMYSGLKESIAGFSKNVFQFFGGSLFLSFAFALITTFGFLWLFIHTGWQIALCFVSMVVGIRLFTSVSSCQNPLWNSLFMIPQQAVFWAILITALIRKLKNKNVWKERNIEM